MVLIYHVSLGHNIEFDDIFVQFQSSDSHGLEKNMQLTHMEFYEHNNEHSMLWGMQIF